MPELTLENIRSGAFPSDAHAVGFLLGEIKKLNRKCAALAYLHYGSQGPADPLQQHVDHVTKPLHAEIELLRKLLDGKTFVTGNEPAKTWEFDRYVNGRLMAEGVGISRAETFEQACRAAVALASSGSVLVVRQSSEPCEQRCDCWERISVLIVKGPLEGDGWDPTAQRNGLILAANQIAPFNRPAQGASRDAPSAKDSCPVCGFNIGDHEATELQRCRDASPADLVGALQDVVHTDPGPVRAGKSVRQGEPGASIAGFPVVVDPTMPPDQIELRNDGNCPTGDWPHNFATETTERMTKGRCIYCGTPAQRTNEQSS